MLLNVITEISLAIVFVIIGNLYNQQTMHIVTDDNYHDMDDDVYCEV